VLTVRVVVFDPALMVMVEGLRVRMGPGVSGVALRVMVPLNRPMLAEVIISVPEELVGMLMYSWLGVRV